MVLIKVFDEFTLLYCNSDFIVSYVCPQFHLVCGLIHLLASSNRISTLGDRTELKNNTKLGSA